MKNKIYCFVDDYILVDFFSILMMDLNYIPRMERL